MTLSVCTWNVNSIRIRLPQLERLVRAEDPDVLCLQEIKCTDAHFPYAAVEALGYPHMAVHGMKGYNGVAILSKRPLEDIRRPLWCDRDDCRHVAAVVDGIEIHNLYVPAGGDKPDPEVNPKFAHKLRFLRDLADWFRGTGTTRAPVMLTGDLNVAPLPTDVWDHKKLSRVVTHTPIEIARLNDLRESLAWVDVARRFVPPEEVLFTWWSYRGGDWRQANRGRRLDHIWVTPALAGRLRAFEIVTDARGWEPPSDHVPVLATVA